MKSPGQFSFKLPELLTLVFELILGASGVLMLVAAINGNPAGMDIPAQALMRLLPVLLCVSFAGWLVFRLRCLGQSESRFWGQFGAVCLTLVALGFGSAVGRLGMVTMTAQFREHFAQLLADPLTREAGTMSYFSFLWIGLVFGITFMLRVGTRRFQAEANSDALHAGLDRIGRRVIGNWSEMPVTRIDHLLDCGQRREAVDLYQKETGCSFNEASLTIADWDAHRLRLQIDLLQQSLTGTSSEQRLPEASSSRQQPASPASDGTAEPAESPDEPVCSA